MPSWGPARYCSVRRLWWLPSRAAKAGPIKLALDTKKKVAGLQVVTELKAPDKRGATRIIPRCARDAQRAVGPGTPDVGTQIKPGTNCTEAVSPGAHKLEPGRPPRRHMSRRR